MGVTLKQLSAEYTPMAWNFHVNPDSCDNPQHYEDYLRLSALGDQVAGHGITHLLISTTSDGNDVTNDSEIIGFVTLRATSLVDFTDGTYYVHPSLEIAKLAVNHKFEHKGYGKTLVDVAIYIANHLKDHFLGIQRVVLCADPRAVGFYENPKIGFGRLNDYYKMPHDGWNNNCIPMFIKLCS